MNQKILKTKCHGSCLWATKELGWKNRVNLDVSSWIYTSRGTQNRFFFFGSRKYIGEMGKTYPVRNYQNGRSDPNWNSENFRAQEKRHKAVEGNALCSRLSKDEETSPHILREFEAITSKEYGTLERPNLIRKKSIYTNIMKESSKTEFFFSLQTGQTQRQRKYHFITFLSSFSLPLPSYHQIAALFCQSSFPPLSPLFYQNLHIR